MDIYFKSDKEVIYFCEKLFQKNKEITVHWKVHKKWGNEIRIESELAEEYVYESIAESLAAVFIAFRLGNIIRTMIRENYYFSDSHEIEQIYELAERIVTSNEKDVLFIRDNKKPAQLLQSIFLMHLRNGSSIRFDSIVQFGMKVFKDELLEYVGLAIDEFKREEEYQSFINSIREYVLRKEPNTSLIHVLEGNPFDFYNEKGKRIPQKELQLFIKKERLYLIGLPDDEWNLAPLIAMYPAEINLYANDFSNAKIQTVLNIFQERVVLHSIRDFPFFLSVKGNRKMGKK